MNIELIDEIIAKGVMIDGDGFGKAIQSKQAAEIHAILIEVKKCNAERDICLKALKEIYADGSYNDIASEIAKKAIDEVSNG